MWKGEREKEERGGKKREGGGKISEIVSVCVMSG